ncbi:protein DMP2-like [Rhodamnia argentea]|uniref:Protein DMP2-like n=1 Tax=Rhodamnia argentea TaxID=178133 RepID=A0A8B8Q3C3_9MYRT|nr:protein DMP2-like [Rhodamnia argentea]
MGNKSSSKSKTDSGQTSTTKKDKLHGLGNVIRLLPTGTVFLFQFLNPVLTNNGKCHAANKYLSAVLIGLCGLSCSLACFTDSYKGKFGLTYYGVATPKGLWPGSSSVDLSGHKLRFGDFVHAFMSVLIFAVLVLLDTNTMRCFYPSFEHTQNTLIMVLPPVTGTISSVVFALFPTKRHGIGYPSSESKAASETKTTSETSTTSESKA